MSSSHPNSNITTSMPEGYGAPISVVNKRSGDPIDPTLDSCCQRELEGNRQWNATQVALRRHDRVARMERIRRNAVQLLASDDNGVMVTVTVCRCSFDPEQDGGEYEALHNLRLVSSSTNNPTTITEDLLEEERMSSEKEDESSQDSDFDYLLEEDELPAAKEFEEQRREDFEEAILCRDLLFQHGYGAMRQMNPLRVMRIAGLADANSTGVCVLHLYDPMSNMSASLDLLLERQAPNYKGTKFIRADGRAVLKMNPYALANNVTDKDLPTLIAIKDGCVIATCPKLLGLGYSTVDANQVIYWLDRANVLIRDPPSEDMLCRISPDVDALLASGIMGRKEDVQQQRFNCGVHGCHKTFYHEHVGVKNEEQDGLLVKEDGRIDTI